MEPSVGNCLPSSNVGLHCFIILRFNHPKGRTFQRSLPSCDQCVVPELLLWCPCQPSAHRVCHPNCPPLAVAFDGSNVSEEFMLDFHRNSTDIIQGAASVYETGYRTRQRLFVFLRLQQEFPSQNSGGFNQEIKVLTGFLKVLAGG